MAKTRHFGNLTVFTAFDENHGFRDLLLSLVMISTFQGVTWRHWSRDHL